MSNFTQYIREVIMLPRIALIGILLITINIVAYSFVEGYTRYLSAQSFAIFEGLAYLYFGVLFAGISTVGLGLYLSLKTRITAMGSEEETPLNLGSLLPYMFTQQGVKRAFLISYLLYGIFYAFATSIIVYRPELKFSEAYLAKVPSFNVSPCCGPPGQVPVLIGYLTDNVGLLIIPLTVLLLVTVSGLVALNVSLTYYAWKNRPTLSRRGWTAGLGGVVGLFTGCPTCAGLFLASMVGGAGATTLALSLAPLQALLIAVTIPVLLVTPYMILQNISKVMEGGCIRPKAPSPRIGQR